MNIATPENIALAAAKIAASNDIQNYFHNNRKQKYGVKWQIAEDDTKNMPFNSLRLRKDAPKAVNNVVVQFNKTPKVVLHRTHGRTTITERLQMALFAKCISLELIAKKFSVSIPTVSIYAKKYAHLV